MRTIGFLGIAAAMATAPAMAESAPGGSTSVPTANDWSGVPTIPLRPPAEMAPQGNWSSGGGWRGERPDPAPHHEWHSGGNRWSQGARPGSGKSWGHWRGDRRAFGDFRPRRGLFMPRLFVSPTFVVWDWHGYGLPEPGHGRRWVRYYDDAVLIDGRGYIHDTAPDIDWERHGPEDEEMRWGWRGYHGYPPAVHYVPVGATTTVIVHGAPVVTTTTTTYVDDEVVHVRPKMVKPRPKCACK